MKVRVWTTDGFFSPLCFALHFSKFLLKKFTKIKIRNAKGKKGNPVGNNFPYANQLHAYINNTFLKSAELYPKLTLSSDIQKFNVKLKLHL